MKYHFLACIIKKVRSYIYAINLLKSSLWSSHLGKYTQSSEMEELSMWHMELDWVIKIALAALLGGLIGFERESLRRPAGLRTHILVAMGATLVSAVNTQIIHDLGDLSNISIAPARYGAAVISGIGFLGAGTIMKEGMNVKGLTTAASLWSVACIGLVIGHGYYAFALTASFVVFITLELFMRIGDKYSFARRSIKLEILVKGKLGVVGKIGDVLESMNVTIVNMSVKSTSQPKETLILTRVKYTKRCNPTQILDALGNLDGILSIKESSV